MAEIIMREYGLLTLFEEVQLPPRGKAKVVVVVQQPMELLRLSFRCAAPWRLESLFLGTKESLSDASGVEMNPSDNRVALVFDRWPVMLFAGLHVTLNVANLAAESVLFETVLTGAERLRETDPS